MTKLIEQLRLAEKAAEDIYFARLDRELIEALHRLARVSPSGPESPGTDTVPPRSEYPAPQRENSPA